MSRRRAEGIQGCGDGNRRAREFGGGTSWVAGGLEHWSWGGSGNVLGGDHGGRTKERKTKELVTVQRSELGYKVLRFL